jgi:hypothetical protein
MNKYKILFGFWNIKNVIEMKFSIRGINTRMINVNGFHTCATGNVNLITPVYLSQTESFSSSPICDQWACVGVPICVNLVGVGGGHNMFFSRT